MNANFVKAALAASVLTLGLSAHAEEGGHDGNGHGGGDHPPHTYICRADARDDSGLFFLGIGHTYGEAFDRALSACEGQRRECSIYCDLQQ